MDMIIVETPWVKTLYGLSSVHVASRKVGDEIRELLDPVWKAVRAYQIKSTGINHVVYGENGEYFCGVECPSLSQEIPGLIKKQFRLDQYAYFKHIGPYSGIPQAYAHMAEEMGKLSLRPGSTSIEIYGHWNNDENLLQTELLISFKK